MIRVLTTGNHFGSGITPLGGASVRANWTSPHCADWVAVLQEAIVTSDAPVILIAHSLGCCLVAHWALRHKGLVRGALFVAPPDIGAPTFPAQVAGFAPTPLMRLPFPSTVVASANDPFCSIARVEYFAEHWGARLTVLGPLGHINDRSGLGTWPAGIELVAELTCGAH